MSNKDDIMEKLDYEEPRLLEMDLGGIVFGAGLSPKGEDPDTDPGSLADDDDQG